MFKLKKTLVLLLLAVATFAVSCSKDEENSNSSKSSSTPTSLEGTTWKYTFSSGYITLNFKTDYVGSMKEYDKGELQSDDSFNYTYEAPDGHIMIRQYDGEFYYDEYDFTVKGNNLTVFDDKEPMVFTKQ